MKGGITMIFSANEREQLEQLMAEKPENKILIQKLLDSSQYAVSKISHELRNPLALVYSSLQLIEKQHPEVREFRHWNEMREDTEFVVELLQELSVYNNGSHLRKTTFSSHDFFSHICLSYAASCVDTGIEFTSRIAPDLPEVTADKVKLQEVFLNLLQNAKDAVSSEGKIRLDVSSSESEVTILLSDNGCGIPAEHLEDIFDTFVTYKSGGTGLGLAIAQRTIQAHHGNITVESEPGKGTRFTIVLPVK